MRTGDKLSFKVGDKALVRDSRYGRTNYTVGIIAKVTPTGRFSCKVQAPTEYTLQFDPNGWQRGGDIWHHKSLEPFDQAKLDAQAEKWRMEELRRTLRQQNWVDVPDEVVEAVHALFPKKSEAA